MNKPHDQLPMWRRLRELRGEPVSNDPMTEFLLLQGERHPDTQEVVTLCKSVAEEELSKFPLHHYISVDVAVTWEGLIQVKFKLSIPELERRATLLTREVIPAVEVGMARKVSEEMLRDMMNDPRTEESFRNLAVALYDDLVHYHSPAS